jgi:aryl-alcohol dehydrogenase-like predicted oxidoreductase
VQWDFTTSIEELMDSLDHYVKQGKVLHLGASNLPVWLVAGCNSYAKCINQLPSVHHMLTHRRATGKTPFVIYQGKWNVLE